MCNIVPNKTGEERYDQVEDAFRDTPGVNASQFFVSENLNANQDNRTCGIIRTFNDTIAKVYGANPDASEWMTIQPINPSMKMVNGTVDIFEKRFKGLETGDSVSIGQNTLNENMITRNSLGVQNILCPGVQDFQMDDVPDEDIVDAIKYFMIGNGGNAAKNASFYYHRVNGKDGANAVYTERMLFWSNAISTVMNLTNASDGSNACLDTIIGEHMQFDIDKEIVNIFSDLSAEETYRLGNQIGMSDDDLEMCIWYMIIGTALNPLVCSVEPTHRVVTLCKDGTSDLSKCGNDAGGNSSAFVWGSGIHVVMMSLLALGLYALF